jgi:drug/metabolite transporter (DMT)-like permease
MLPPAAALTLLFQFVWMGLIVQAVTTKTLPRLSAVFTVLLVVFGAVLATGILDEGVSLSDLSPLGVLFGALSAVCYTAYLALASRVATQIPAVNRSLFNSLGCVVIAFMITPDYFENPLLVHEPLLGVGLAALGFCVPAVLIALSAPKLPTSLTTVMASSELPSGVLCAAVFIGSPVTLTIGLGVVLVLVGIVVSEHEGLKAIIKSRDKPQRE